jgi:hypothetical protein
VVPLAKPLLVTIFFLVIQVRGYKGLIVHAENPLAIVVGMGVRPGAGVMPLKTKLVLGADAPIQVL